MNETVESFLAQRKAVGLMFFTLPPMLWLVGMVVHGVPLQNSISAYYFTPMRDLFIADIAVASAFLFSYKGYNWRERWAAKIAAAAANGVSMFPVSMHGFTWSGAAHTVCAMVFFLTLAYFSAYQFTQSTGPLTPQKVARNRIYRGAAGIVVACIGMMVFNAFIARNADAVFWFESIALMAIGVSWAAKGKFWLADTQAVTLPS